MTNEFVATENIAKAPTSLDAHHQRTHSYEFLKEHAKAIKDLSYCVAKSPSRADISDRAKAKTAKMHYLRGLAQRKVHHFGDTVYDFGQALSLQDGTLSYSERAQIAAMLKEFKTASKFYTKAIQSVELSDSELASALRLRVAARREQQSPPASTAE